MFTLSSGDRSQGVEEDLNDIPSAGFREHARETLRVPQHKSAVAQEQMAQPPNLRFAHNEGHGFSRAPLELTTRASVTYEMWDTADVDR